MQKLNAKQEREIRKKEKEWQEQASDFDKKFAKFRSKLWKELKKERSMNVIDLAVIIYLVWRLSTGSQI